MLHALLLLAAEEAETSKAAYYIAGAAAAIWAVVVSFVGLRSASFPRNPAVARGVMAVSAILAVASMATAVITA
jgi:hypothetical protein